MPKMKRVFLDMDGVLANFTGGVDKAHGKQLDWTRWDGGIENREEFWSPIYHKVGAVDFWSNLEPLPWGHRLISIAVSLVGIDNVYILSAPHREPCATPKIQWVKKHFPIIKDENIIIGRDKNIVAKWDHLLIDDREETMAGFTKEYGKFILFPALWNSKRDRAKDPLSYVAEQIQEQTLT